MVQKACWPLFMNTTQPKTQPQFPKGYRVQARVVQCIGARETAPSFLHSLQQPLSRTINQGGVLAASKF